MSKPKYSIKFNMIYLTEEDPPYNERYRYKHCILFDTHLFGFLDIITVDSVIDWYRNKHSNNSLKEKLLFKMSNDEVIDRLIKEKKKYNSSFAIMSAFHVNEMLAILMRE